MTFSWLNRRLAAALLSAAGALCAQPGSAGDPAQREWEGRYREWRKEQARLDDGFLVSIAAGLSPARVGARFDAPDTAGYPAVDFRGYGGTLDFRMGWLVGNDLVFGNLPIRGADLHDQLYLSLDLLTRTTPYPERRFTGGDTANDVVFFRPRYMTDLILGAGATWLFYPSRTSLGVTAGFGTLGIQGRDRAVRTGFGPTLVLRAGQEWSPRENWRTGFAVSYASFRAVNRPEEQGGFQAPEEHYRSRLFSVQWLNSFTPPKYRRGLPPARPQ